MNREEIKSIYRKRARHYNLTANLYYLVGYREFMYRNKAVNSLNLKLGDKVVDICCGTGLNFQFLEDKVGPNGKIIGVDLTDAMLERAKERVNKNGWGNVELVQSDACEYNFPKNVNGVLTTYALSLVPNYDKVVGNAYGALVPGGRFVDMSIKMPDNFLKHFRYILFPLVKPFGDPEEYINIRTWESVETHFDKHDFKEFFGGITYISVGEKSIRDKNEFI